MVVALLTHIIVVKSMALFTRHHSRLTDFVDNGANWVAGDEGEWEVFTIKNKILLPKLSLSKIKLYLQKYCFHQ